MGENNYKYLIVDNKLVIGFVKKFDINIGNIWVNYIKVVNIFDIFFKVKVVGGVVFMVLI